VVVEGGRELCLSHLCRNFLNVKIRSIWWHYSCLKWDITGKLVFRSLILLKNWWNDLWNTKNMHTHTHKHLIYYILLPFESINPLLINWLDHEVLRTYHCWGKRAFTFFKVRWGKYCGYFCSTQFTRKQCWQFQQVVVWWDLAVKK
jgi:hypothetical protein